jgi:general secretion pathway protein I
MTMNRHRSGGFTLIEVLIALMILAISLTAIVKATASDIQNTYYLKQKSIANLVAAEAFQLIKMHAVVLNANNTDQKKAMANDTWFWHAIKRPIETKNISKIIIEVSHHHQNILTTTHYLLEDQQ